MTATQTASALGTRAPVLEVFASLQGEGLFVGEPQVYLVGRQAIDESEIDRFLNDNGVDSWSTEYARRNGLSHRPLERKRLISGVLAYGEDSSLRVPAKASPDPRASPSRAGA